MQVKIAVTQSMGHQWSGCSVRIELWPRLLPTAFIVSPWGGGGIMKKSKSNEKKNLRDPKNCVGAASDQKTKKHQKPNHFERGQKEIKKTKINKKRHLLVQFPDSQPKHNLEQLTDEY